MYIGFKSKLILSSSPGASVGFLSTSLQPSIYQVGLILIYLLYFIANSLTDVGRSRLASVIIALLCPRRSRRASSLCFDIPFFRSGTYYYKPDIQHSCCPHYTIRYYVAPPFPEDVLIPDLAWMRQLSIREESSVKPSTDGTSM